MLPMYVSAGRQAEITLGGRPVFLLLYADDIVTLLISAEHSPLTTNRVCEYIEALGLSLNVPKCALMHISRIKARLPSPPSFFIKQTEVDKSTQFKYLGASINSSNNYTQTRLANVPTACAASAVMLRGLTRTVAHAPVCIGVELFGTFVKWVASTGHVIFNEWFPSESCLLKNDKLNQVSTRCAKTLLGVRRTTSYCGLYHITGILPPTLQIVRMTVNFYIKVARSSSDELEACVVRRARSLRPKTNPCEPTVARFPVQKVPPTNFRVGRLSLSRDFYRKNM
ncbi:hypothetical protein RvY_16212 [Ramazzottius varieornatus]|uniref:Reverse transcriptase domain-containing protein n=1 Tax=Ramazzottius varieornatus TaxID=947166 RepID=A0A1D1VXM9_RAMVA|nr:hypothetical protein RvY_16212 [Ramazzottius varieornatus]